MASMSSRNSLAKRRVLLSNLGIFGDVENLPWVGFTIWNERGAWRLSLKMGAKIVHVLIGILWATTCGMVDANCGSSTIGQACNHFNSSSNYKFSAVFDDACYAFMGSGVTVPNFEKAFDACNVDKGLFNYARTAVFKTPDSYQQFMAMLKTKGVNEYIVLGAANDGRDGAKINEFAWALDKTKSMCYVFDEDGDPGPDTSGATVTKVGTAGMGPGNEKRAPNDLTSSYYVLCGNPTYPLDFWGYANGNIGLTYICEFGCENAPNYPETHEWWDIDKSLASTSTSTTSTTTPTGPTTTTAASATCDTNYLESIAASTNGHFENNVNPDFGGPTVYYYHNATGRIPYELEATCRRECNITGAQGRLATFSTHNIYVTVSNELFDKGKSGRILFGAVGPNLESNLNAFTWECWVDVCQGSEIMNAPETDSIPVEILSCAPKLILALDPLKPDRFYAYNLSSPTALPFLCQCQCGSNYSRLPNTQSGWTDLTGRNPNPLINNCTTTTTTASSASPTSPTSSVSQSSTLPQVSSTPAIGTPSVPQTTASPSSATCDVNSCNQYNRPNNFQYSMVIDGICYAFMGTFSKIESFDSAYDECDQAKKDATVANKFAYARVAVFKTPTVYNKFMAMLKTNGITNYIVIGAVNDGQSTGSLNEYMWAKSKSKSMFYVFTKDGTSNPNPTGALAEVTVIGRNSSSPRKQPPGSLPSAYYTLGGNPDSPLNLQAYADQFTSMPYACEFGCGTAPMYDETPEWYELYTSPTTAIASTSTLTPKTVKTSTRSLTSTNAAVFSSTFSAKPDSSANPNACDISTVQFALDLMVRSPFRQTFLHSETVTNANGTYTDTYVYGYVKRPSTPDPSSLSEMDRVCAQKCQSIDSGLHGRTAILRSLDAYGKAYNMTKALAPPKGGGIIGAVTKTPDATILTPFYWTNVGTNDPNTNTPCSTMLPASLSVLPDTNDGEGPVKALVIYAQFEYPNAFTSFNVMKLTPLDYICECGCTPYTQDTTTPQSTTTTTTVTSTTTASSSAANSASSSAPTSKPYSSGASVTVTSSASCDGALMQSVRTKIEQGRQLNPFNADKLFNEASTGTTFWYGLVNASHGSPSSLVMMDSLCMDICQSANTNFHGRSAILRSQAAYDSVFAMLANKSNIIIAIIGAASTEMNADKLKQYFWSNTNTNDPCTLTPIVGLSTDDVAPKTNDSNHLILGIAVYDKGFVSFNITQLFGGYDYLCECGCTPYDQACPSTTTTTTTTTTELITTTPSGISSSTSAGAPSSTATNSTNSGPISTASPLASSVTSSAACDETLMQSVRSDITGNPLNSPFEADLFFKEPSAGTTFWYGFAKAGCCGYANSLEAMDGLCSDMCQEANPVFYGRTAILRSKAAFDTVYSMLEEQGDTTQAIIGGASSYEDANKLNQFFWTTTNTNDPCLSSPIMSHSTINVTRKVYGLSNMALGISVRPDDPPGFISIDVGWLAGVYDYLCECGCTPYVQVGSTAPWWDTPSTTTTTSTTTSEPATKSSSSSATALSTSFSEVSSSTSTGAPSSTTTKSTNSEPLSTASPSITSSTSGVACDATLLQSVWSNIEAGQQSNPFNVSLVFSETSTRTTFWYGFARRLPEQPKSLIEMDQLCGSRCQSANTNFYGRTAIFRSKAAYDTVYPMLETFNGNLIVMIGAASTEDNADNLNQYMWTTNNTNDPCPSSPITTLNTIAVKPRTRGSHPVLGISVRPDDEGFIYVDAGSIGGIYDYLCECGCAPYVQVGSTAPWWDTQTTTTATTTTTGEPSTTSSPVTSSSTILSPKTSSPVSSISSSSGTGTQTKSATTSSAVTSSTTSFTGSTSGLSRSTASSQTSSGSSARSISVTSSQTSQASTAPATCDNTVIQSYEAKIQDSSLNPFDGNIFFTEPSTITYWYGYVANNRTTEELPSTLIDVDNLCSNKCRSANPQFYGRSAILRSWAAYEAVYEGMKPIGYANHKSGVIIGAVSTVKKDTTLDQFFWSITGTNDPSTAKITSQSTISVGKASSASGSGPSMALSIDLNEGISPTIRKALYSFDATVLAHRGYLCECGCAPYDPVGSTAPGWDLPTTAISTTTIPTTTASTTTSPTTTAQTTTSPTTAAHNRTTSSAATTTTRTTSLSAATTTVLGACDNKTVDRILANKTLLAKSKFDANFKFTHIQNAGTGIQNVWANYTLWYGYVANDNSQSSPLTLQQMDASCMTKCTDFDSRLYGRMAIFRTPNSFTSVYEDVRKRPDRARVMLGAVSTVPSPSTLDLFHWTDIGTADPCMDCPITTKAVLNVTRGAVVGSTMALGMDLSQAIANQSLFSWDANRLDGMDWLCECQCAPYIPVKVSPRYWGQAPVTTTTSTKTSTTSTTTTTVESTSTSTTPPEGTTSIEPITTSAVATSTSATVSASTSSSIGSRQLSAKSSPSTKRSSTSKTKPTSTSRPTSRSSSSSSSRSSTSSPLSSAISSSFDASSSAMTSTTTAQQELSSSSLALTSSDSSPMSTAEESTPFAVTSSTRQDFPTSTQYQTTVATASFDETSTTVATDEEPGSTEQSISSTPFTTNLISSAPIVTEQQASSDPDITELIPSTASQTIKITSTESPKLTIVESVQTSSSTTELITTELTDDESADPQEPTVILDLDLPALSSSAVEITSTTAALETTGIIDSTRTETVESSSSIQSTSKAKSRKMMVKTEGSMAPIDQLVMQTETIPTSTFATSQETTINDIWTTAQTSSIAVTTESDYLDSSETTSEELETTSEKAPDDLITILIDSIDQTSTPLAAVARYSIIVNQQAQSNAATDPTTQLATAIDGLDSSLSESTQGQVLSTSTPLQPTVQIRFSMARNLDGKSTSLQDQPITNADLENQATVLIELNNRQATSIDQNGRSTTTGDLQAQSTSTIASQMAAGQADGSGILSTFDEGSLDTSLDLGSTSDQSLASPVSPSGSTPTQSSTATADPTMGPPTSLRPSSDLLDLFYRPLFRIPPGVHIDNSANLLPRSRMNMTTLGTSSATPPDGGFSGWTSLGGPKEPQDYPSDAFDNYSTTNPFDHSSQPSLDTSTDSAGNLNQMHKETPSWLSSLPQESSQGLHSAPDPVDSTFPQGSHLKPSPPNRPEVTVDASSANSNSNSGSSPEYNGKLTPVYPSPLSARSSMSQAPNDGSLPSGPPGVSEPTNPDDSESNQSISHRDDFSNGPTGSPASSGNEPSQSGSDSAHSSQEPQSPPNADSQSGNGNPTDAPNDQSNSVPSEKDPSRPEDGSKPKTSGSPNLQSPPTSPPDKSNDPKFNNPDARNNAVNTEHDSADQAGSPSSTSSNGPSNPSIDESGPPVTKPQDTNDHSEPPKAEDKPTGTAGPSVQPDQMANNAQTAPTESASPVNSISPTPAAPTGTTQPANPTSPTGSPAGLTGSTGVSPPASNSATPTIPLSSSDRPSNTSDGSSLGTDQSTEDPDAGDMDKDDVTGARPADPMSKEERMAANIMHSLGCIWVVGCCGSCFVLGLISNPRSPDRQMSSSQELSLMLQHLLILLWHDATEHNTLCTAISIAIQYFTLVFYTSMLLDSIRNLLILVAFHDRPNQISSAAMQVTAWAAPGLLAALSGAMYYKHYDSAFSCWINAGHEVAYLTIVPVSLMSALGIIINEASGTLAPCQLVPNDLKCSHNSSSISRNGFFFVLPLSLCSWAIGFSAVYYQNLPVYVTVSGINIALGVEVVFFHALQNDQIRALLERLWAKIKGVI